jgi:hypothetical protein
VFIDITSGIYSLFFYRLGVEIIHNAIAEYVIITKDAWNVNFYCRLPKILAMLGNWWLKFYEDWSLLSKFHQKVALIAYVFEKVIKHAGSFVLKNLCHALNFIF